MHICIIDMQFYKNNICDFQRVFEKIDKNITITILKFSHERITQALKSIKPDGIIITGSRYRILHKDAIDLPKDILKLGIPVLGICYGFEWQMKKLHGGLSTYPITYPNNIHKYHRIFETRQPFHIPKKLYYYAHYDFITDVPHNWMVVHKKGNQIHMAYDRISKHMGIQFHPEKHMASGVAFFSAWINWIKNL